MRPKRNLVSASVAFSLECGAIRTTLVPVFRVGTMIGLVQDWPAGGVIHHSYQVFVEFPDVLNILILVEFTRIFSNAGQ